MENSNITMQSEKISKSFGGIKAVNNLDIKFYSGKILGLVGPNGSGKTTLVNLLTGVYTIDSGKIKIGDSFFSKILPNKILFYGITRTFQKIRLIEQISVLENIAMVVAKKDIISAIFENNKKFNLNKSKEILKKVGLLEKQNEAAENLSYGQRKLLEIGRVLATNSEIYFFDEPFAGLSPKMREIISEIILELKDQGKTIILIEHDMEIIKNLSDKIFVLAEGKKLKYGKPEEVLSDMEVKKAYLG